MAEKKPIEAGIIARVSGALKYAVTGVAPAGWFTPSQPSIPQAQEQTVGRQFDYPAGYNIRITPRSEESVSFSQMRALADAYDLLRLVLETRKDQIVKLTWNFKPIDEKQKSDDRVKQLKAFFRSPDKEHTWQTWLRMLLEDLFVLDAPAIYPRPTRGGGLYALELVDGATIKRVLDDQGRTPLPPSPAYQQVLKGVVTSDYTREQLLYLPRNMRTNKVYGYGPVEQIIATVNIALRRQLHQLQYYTDGSTPDMIFSVPEAWTNDQITTYKESWDAMLAGNTATRRGTMFVRDGMKPLDTKEKALKDEYDEWLARVVCYAFSVSPVPFIKMMNRATAESIQQMAMEEGLAPIQAWIKDMIDTIIWKYFGWEDIEFAWDEESEIDPRAQAEINNTKIRNGTKTINEARAEDGLEAVEHGDKPMIFTASGAILLEDVIDPPEPPPGLINNNSPIPLEDKAKPGEEVVPPKKKEPVEDEEEATA